MKKVLLKLSGYAAVGLGFAGAFLPLLPTTPFLLLAVYCFSKSSPEMNEWILRNRFCGEYLRNYQEGRGIPFRVKIASILALWGSMAFTAIVFIEPLWLKALLYFIALCVTIHILHIRPSVKKYTAHILFPTRSEIEPFWKTLPKGVKTSLSGVGTISTICELDRVLNERKPGMIILAGIAGAYPDSGLSIGDTVLVCREITADTGSCSDGTFSPKFATAYDCPYAESFGAGLKAVASHTVSIAANPMIGPGEAQIENMEGAAFFAFCLQKQVPFLELRTVSNYVGDPFSQWNIPLATANLARTLTELIEEIKQPGCRQQDNSAKSIAFARPISVSPHCASVPSAGKINTTTDGKPYPHSDHTPQ